MTNTLKTEEAAQFLAGCYMLYLLPLDVAWWLWIIIFLAPDLGMLGYLVSTKVGAFTYNLFHYKLIGVALTVWGFAIGHTILEAAGIVVFAHASFDRMLGYGLKYPDSFKNTHLGQLP